MLARIAVRRRVGCCSCLDALAPATSGPAAPGVLLIVRLSSELTVQAVRQDCSFAKKRESPPALLVVVRSGRLRRRGVRAAPERAGLTDFRSLSKSLSLLRRLFEAVYSVCEIRPRSMS
jgi:hypothetical protein